MSKKSIFKSIIGVIGLGIAAWAIIPIFMDKEVSESAPERATVITSTPPLMEDGSGSIQEGEQAEIAEQPSAVERVSQFQGRNNYDAEGTVKLIEDESGNRFVRFEDNFKSDNGPDLIVYIGTDNDRGTSLGALKGNLGSQNYEIPSDLDLAGVDTVRIFCRSFNVDFAIATL